MRKQIRILGLLSLAFLFTGCATNGTASLIQEPDVRLTKVQVNSLSFEGQSFLLGFDVSNPNGFPLPIESVRYHVRFDGQEFATGESVGDFNVPANANGSFSVVVNMDVLASTSHLSSLVRTGMSETVRYELFGKLELDIPFSPTVDFSNKGVIAMEGGL